MWIDLDVNRSLELRSQNLDICAGRHYWGNNAVISPPVALWEGFEIGDNTKIDSFSYSMSRISGVRSIGRYVSIARNVVFTDMEHPVDWLSTSSFTYSDQGIWGNFQQQRGEQGRFFQLPMTKRRTTITIGNDAWIGLGAYISGGVVIGDGAIIGANAVVTKDVPPYAVVVGNPGRIVKYRFSDVLIERLLRLKWWNYCYLDFDKVVDFRNTERAVGELEEMVASETLREYRPNPFTNQDILPPGRLEAVGSI